MTLREPIVILNAQMSQCTISGRGHFFEHFKVDKYGNNDMQEHVHNFLEGHELAIGNPGMNINMSAC